MLIEGLIILIVASLGGAFASFLGVVAERPLRGESLMGSSHCVCGRKLKAYENIPVLGWAMSGGRAKCCGTSLPAVYFWTELLCSVAFLPLGVVFLRFLINDDTSLVLLTTFAIFIAISSLVCSFWVLRATAKRANLEKVYTGM